MRWYICHYPANPNYARQQAPKDGEDLVGSYSSFIWANSFRHARVLAKRRNIGEVVDGQWGGARSEPYPAASKMLAQTPKRKYRKFSELETKMSPASRAEARRRADSLLRPRVCFPKFQCDGSRAKWAVFHDHAEYMKDFDPDNAIFVSACDDCLPAALRQDPAAHNYIRRLL